MRNTLRVPAAACLPLPAVLTRPRSAPPVSLPTQWQIVKSGRYHTRAEPLSILFRTGLKAVFRSPQWSDTEQLREGYAGAIVWVVAAAFKVHPCELKGDLADETVKALSQSRDNPEFKTLWLSKEAGDSDLDIESDSDSDSELPQMLK